MGGKCKFQVQDTDLEYLFWRLDKRIPLSEKKLPLVSQEGSELYPRREWYAIVSENNSKSWHQNLSNEQSKKVEFTRL